MRLLNTETLLLTEFYTDIPPYAILSHTWGEGEVTFKDIQDFDVGKSKAGWSKITSACAHAREYMFEWIWIDSCCIDKSSSAELSEAINSMYQYYEDAEVCYAFLSDVSSEKHPRDTESNFRSSRWFQRGWTLQELLAPKYLVFFDENWTELGTKWNLRDVISAITSIPVKVFEGRDINKYSIAQKMSWAASRETTRPEDQAYSLMGVFGVNMSPIYGEGGPKAFMRLQQEIIKISDDRSVFAWTSTSGNPSELRGLFARSPEEFRASGTVGPSNTDFIEDKSSFSFANNGLHIHLPLTPIKDLPKKELYPGYKVDGDIYLAHLNCQSERDGSYLYIYLQRTTGRRYIRYDPNKVALIPPTLVPKTENLKEIVIKEVSLPHRVRPRQKLFIRLSIRLSSESLAFTGHRDCSMMSKDATEIIVDVHNSYHWEATDEVSVGAHSRLIFQDHNTGESFHVIYKMANGIEGIAFDLQDQTFQDNMPMDRALTCLNGSTHVIIALQMTGQKTTQIEQVWPPSRYLTRLLEIKCDAKDHDGSGMVNLATELLQPSNYGFIVPNKLDLLYLRKIFPPSHFDHKPPDQHHILCNKHYISIPNIGNRFRILEYGPLGRHNNWYSSFYVLLGLHENEKAWVHLTYENQLSIEEIWETCQTSNIKRLAIAKLNKTFCDIDATTYRCKTLQVNSHLLDLK